MSDALVVRGGEGGVAVNLAELGDLAALLRDAARGLGLAAASLRAAMIRLRPGAELAPAAGGRALGALEGALSRAQGLAAEVDGLAEAVTQARGRYEGAELNALELLDQVMAGRWSLLPVPRLDDVLRPLGWALALEPRTSPAVRLRIVGERDRPAPAPTGARDLIAGIEALYPAAGGEAGSLEVRRIEHSSGATSWAVLIPGTQTLAVGGANPMDNATNAQAYVGAPHAVGSAVLAALAAAGARRGEPVLLAGHSQGGLVAMRLAAEPAVRRRYGITAVLTAGSPVGHLPTPAGVSVLHLEHTGDVVPMLDAAVNPDEADRTTVWHGGSGPAPAVPGAGAGGAGASVDGGGAWVDPEQHAPVSRGGAHDASSYARTAALVDDSGHASVLAWRERAVEALGDDAATATRTVYAAARPDPLVAVAQTAVSGGPRRDGGGG